MSAKENKALARHCIEEVHNKRNVAAMDEFFSTHVPALFSLASWIERLREAAAPNTDKESAEALKTLEGLWPGEDRLLIARMMAGRPYKKAIADVRDIVQGVIKATKSEACIGHALNISSVPFTWIEAVPYLSERIGMDYVEACLPTIPTHYELDLSRARDLIGYEPQYTIFRMIDDALAFQRGEDIGIIPR